MARVAEWFECEEGYPTDASIERLAGANFDMHDADAFLRNDLPAIAEGIACLSVSSQPGEGWRGPVLALEFHTGGWSGAEDLIDAMLKNFWINHLHTKWERGGHFYFELSASPPQRKAAA